MTKTDAPLAPSRTSDTRAVPGRLRLHYLDGMRGLASLYVVLHHVLMETIQGPESRLATEAFPGLFFLMHGEIAVAVFIVLSGYCLMLPLAASGRPGGEGNPATSTMARASVTRFMARRARRILPPYYAALGLTLALVWLTPSLQQPRGVRWDAALPALTPGPIWSHLALLHNWNPAWIGTINPPMWSVAVEWQIYFLFPLLLAPLWKRGGLMPLVLAGLTLGLCPLILFRATSGLRWTCPWYVSLFAFGMAAAALSFARRDSNGSAAEPFWERTTWWGLLACLLLAGPAAAVTLGSLAPRLPRIPGDLLLGAGTACLLIYCTRRRLAAGENKHAGGLLLRFFEAPLLVKVGVFSYSLYLLHFPVLSALHLLLEPLHLSLGQTLLTLMVGGVAVSLLLAYGFHCLFERPFLNAPASKRSAREPTATTPAA